MLERLLFEEPTCDSGENTVSCKPSINSRIDTDPAITFKIYSAVNGKVIEFYKYDRVTDKSHTSVYIVGKDEDVAERVGRCLSLELLK